MNKYERKKRNSEIALELKGVGAILIWTALVIALGNSETRSPDTLFAWFLGMTTVMVSELYKSRGLDQYSQDIGPR